MPFWGAVGRIEGQLAGKLEGLLESLVSRWGLKGVSKMVINTVRFRRAACVGLISIGMSVEVWHGGLLHTHYEIPNSTVAVKVTTPMNNISNVVPLSVEDLDL